MSVNCDPSDLAKKAACFQSCIPQGMMPSVQTYLLCVLAQLSESLTPSTGGGDRQIYSNVFADPNVGGIVPDNLTIANWWYQDPSITLYNWWAWSIVNQTWVQVSAPV